MLKVYQALKEQRRRKKAFDEQRQIDLQPELPADWSVVKPVLCPTCFGTGKYRSKRCTTCRGQGVTPNPCGNGEEAGAKQSRRGAADE